MPIEINLLPGKKRRAKTLPMLLLLIGVLGLVGLLAIISVGASMENERQLVEEELENTRLEAAALQSEIEELQESDVLVLNAMIEQLEEKVAPASSVLMDIVSRMPADSGLTMFEYNYPDQVTLELLLMSMPDLARFQFELEDSALIQQAEVDVVMGEAILEELEDNPFWYEDYLPQYFATMELVLHPDAVRAYEQQEEELPQPGEFENQEEAEEPADTPLDEGDMGESMEPDNFNAEPWEEEAEQSENNDAEEGSEENLEQNQFDDNNEVQEEMNEENFEFNWEDNEENEVEQP